MGINAEERATNAAKRKKIDFPTTVIINIVWYDLDKQINDFSESKDGARPVGADDCSVASTIPNAPKIIIPPAGGLLEDERGA